MYAIAIGANTGTISQGDNAVAIGYGAGNCQQGGESVAIGHDAGAGGYAEVTYVSGGVSTFDVTITPAYSGIVVGMFMYGSTFPFSTVTAVNVDQTVITLNNKAPTTPSGTLTFWAQSGTETVAVGLNAGKYFQGSYSVAIGSGAGQTNQSQYSIAIGTSAGLANLGTYSIAIGAEISTAGNSSIILDTSGGFAPQIGNNAIVLNASSSSGSGGPIDDSFRVAPVRNDTSNIANLMYYNIDSNEITYANTINISGNITGGNLIGPYANGNSNIAITSNSNITLYVAGNTTARFTATTTGIVANGTANISGNLSAGNISLIKSGNSNITLTSNANISMFTAGNGTAQLVLTSTGANIPGTVTFAAVYATTVTTPRNVFIDATGKLGGISSINASKINITPVTDSTWLYQVSPVTFNYRKRDENGNYLDEFETELQYGLIAEEVEAVKPEFCIYVEKDGKQVLQGVHYDRMISPLIKEIQNQKTLITSLISRIEALENIANDSA